LGYDFTHQFLENFVFPSLYEFSIPRQFGKL
jgi:hypothetical protein